MSQLLPVLPVLVPLLTGILLALASDNVRWISARWINVYASGLLLVVGLVLSARAFDGQILVATLGDWQAPFGIVLVADLFSASMVAVTGLIALACAITSAATPDTPARTHAMTQLLLAGVCGAFLTGDLFNLYVWFEIMLIAALGLLAGDGGRKGEKLRAALKYAGLNLVSTILMLIAIGMIYGMTGTLTLADLHGRIALVENREAVAAVAVLFGIAVGIKAAIFPLFFWLPTSYPNLPTPLAALFAGLLTKVGVYVLMRCYTLIFVLDEGPAGTLLLVSAGLTMLTGVLGAAAQGNIFNILSFHIVSQIGYMILGLALMTPLALMGAVFYVIHHIIVKANLFLIGGLVRRLTGSTDLDRCGGLSKSAPWLAVLFLIPALSLAGFPPLSGFWAKLTVVRAGLEAEAWLLSGVALLVGLLTVFSMSKIWAEAFWKPHPDGEPRSISTLGRGEAALRIAPIAALALITLGIGLYPVPLLDISAQVADALLNPAGYVTAVMGTAIQSGGG